MFFDTGHSVTSTLKEVKWIGKIFESAEDSNAMVVPRGGKGKNLEKWIHTSVNFVESGLLSYSKES